MERKILVAFDFDHTLIKENSDIHVQKLSPDGRIPDEIKSKYRKDGWTEYMAAIFKYLHDHGVTRDDIINCMEEMNLIEGMDALLKFLGDSAMFEVIIISDSNSQFINMILKAAGLDHCVYHTYTNPAEFDSKGCLKIEYYHTQDWCDLSTVNLCKGHILESHIEQAKQRGVTFSKLAYVGDGSNDFCPSLRLGEGDIVFARTGYSLWKKVTNLPQDNGLHARVVAWETGNTIMAELQGVHAAVS